MIPHGCTIVIPLRLHVTPIKGLVDTAPNMHMSIASTMVHFWTLFLSLTENFCRDLQLLSIYYVISLY